MSHDQSDWLNDNSKDASSSEEEKPKEQPKRGRGGRDAPAEQKREVKEPSKKQKQGESNLGQQEMSYWLDGLQQQEEPAGGEVRGVRGKKFEAEMSFVLQPEQLQPDKQIETSWIVSDKPKQAQQGRGNRGNRNPPNDEKPKEQPKEEQQEPTPRRGNREPANFQKRQPYGGDQGGNNYRQGNDRRYGEYDEGNRGRGRGRGRGGGRGGYWGREGQQDNEGRFGRSDQDGSFKKRDNQQYRAKNIQNEAEEQPRRGNRNDNRSDNYQPRQYNNYNNGNSNSRQYDNREGGRPYNNNYNQNRSYNNNQNSHNNYNREGNRDYRRNYEKDHQTKGDSNEDWSNGDNNREYNRQPNFAKKKYVEAENKPVPKSTPPPHQATSTSTEKEEPLIPKGRHCWPESSIYILGCRFSVSYRPIAQFRAKLLVIPYASLKMEYYPGNIINSSEVDYKARILAKGDKISSAGEVYLQKAVSVGNFTALAFLKIDEKRVNDSLKRGIKKLLGMVESVDGAELSSLLFPICHQLGSVDTIISSFQENLENCSRVREVYVMTNQSGCFMDAMKIFMGTVQEMLDQNKVLIN